MAHVAISRLSVDRRGLPSAPGVTTIRVHNVHQSGRRSAIPAMPRPGDIRALVPLVEQFVEPAVPPAGVLPRRLPRETVIEALRGVPPRIRVPLVMASAALLAEALPAEVPLMPGLRVKVKGRAVRSGQTGPNVRLSATVLHPAGARRRARVRRTHVRAVMQRHLHVAATVTVVGAARAPGVIRVTAAFARPPAAEGDLIGPIDRCCLVRLFRNCRPASLRKCSTPPFAVSFEASLN